LPVRRRINRFLVETNQNPQPFIWTADSHAIIEKVRRGKLALNVFGVAGLKSGQDRLKGSQTRRSAGRAADLVRIGGQSQDGRSARPDDPALDPRPRR
jgi:hypothetical protein